MREVPNWDQYFMNIADAVSKRSKDNSTQVGAIIVDENKHIISTGFNGLPPGFPDTDYYWEKPIKYNYVVHAEANAIAHSVKSPVNSTIYSSMYPCKDCAKLIAAAGIKKVVYSDDKYKNPEAQEIFLHCNISVQRQRLGKP